MYQFAKIHKVLYEHHEEIPEEYFEDIENIATGMEKLGFNMDCGKSMNAAFPGINMFNDIHALKSVMDRSSIQLLGDAIYSQWRYWNHWAMSPIGDQDYEWFALAFDGLARLVKNEMKKDNEREEF